jgi:hypothetical protein
VTAATGPMPAPPASRNDPNYSTRRPIGNDADGNVVPSIGAFGSTRPVNGGSWAAATKLSDVTSNADYE